MEKVQWGGSRSARGDQKPLVSTRPLTPWAMRVSSVLPEAWVAGLVPVVEQIARHAATLLPDGNQDIRGEP